MFLFLFLFFHLPFEEVIEGREVAKPLAVNEKKIKNK